jgi:hypothetical protein
MSLALDNLHVDGIITGNSFSIRKAVLVVSTTDADITTAYANGQIVDGITLTTDDRILLIAQTPATQNGIYIVQASGTPLRAQDLPDGSSASGIQTTVLSGTVDFASIYVCTNKPGSDTTGINNLTFTKSNIPSGVIPVTQGGTGLTSLTNNTFLTASSTTTMASTKVVPSGGVVGTTDSQLLTNKTLTYPTINPTATNHILFSAGTNLNLDVINQTSSTSTLQVPNLSGTTDTIVLTSLPQTLSNKTLTTLSVTNDANIYGNLNVYGTTTTLDSTRINVASNFITLNSNYTTNAQLDAGINFVYYPTTTQTTLTGNFVEGVLGVSNPTVSTTTNPFVNGDLILISGSADVNDGLYEVLSNAANVLTIKGVGLTSPIYNFVENQFTNLVVPGSSIATKVNVSVLKTNLATGVLQQGFGSNTSAITFYDILSSNTVTLQIAYNNSLDPEITLNTSGITIKDNATPISGNLFEIQNNASTILMSSSLTASIYGTNIAIGYNAITPPANGAIIQGNTSVGSSSATSLFNVGSSNQFQINATGIITNGIWQGSTIAPTYGGTGSNLSATGGTSQVLRQSTVGGNITVSQLAASDLSNGTTGSGTVVLANTPTLVTPLLGTPTSGILTNCTGYTTANLSGTINLATQVNGILPATNGGTGQNIYTVGDILYASSTTALSKLAAGTINYVLTSGGPGVAPSWVAISTLGVSSIAGTSNQISASSSIGAVTLSLPSTIVTPGTLAVNGSLVANTSLTSTSTNMYNMWMTGTQIAVNGSNNQGGLVANQTLQPTDGATNSFAIYDNPILIAPNTKTITNTGGIIVSNTYGSNVGTLTNVYGIYATAGSGSTGTITNSYGGYFQTQTAGNSKVALYADSLLLGYASTTTAGATTTLTNASLTQQFFTGSTTQTVILPVVSTLFLGYQFQIHNRSSGVVTVQSSGLNTITAMPANTSIKVTCILTSGTSAASWDFTYNGSTSSPVTSITGTVNQITASSPTGAVTLSISTGYLGQTSITTLGTITTGTWQASIVSPIYGGTGSNLSATGGTSQVLRQSTVGGNVTVSQLAASDLSNGTTGSGAVVLANTPTLITPLLGTPTSGTLTNCTGYTTANLSGTISLTTQVSGVLPATNGGTGTGTYATGDILYSNATNSLAKLPIVVSGNALISGTTPSWGKIGLTTHVSGILNIANGGTALSSTPTNGQLLIGNGTNYTLATITGTASRLSITNGVGSITLNIDTNYTGQTSITTLGTITTGAWQGTLISPTYGGTGVNNSALTITLAGGGTGKVLASDVSGNATWQLLSGLGVTSIAGTANQITVSSPTGAVTLSISTGYLGQTSITTLGTITTGTWQGTIITPTYGGTGSNLSATGGTSQVLRQSTVGGNVTVSQLAASDLSNGTTGTGAVVLAANPTFTNNVNINGNLVITGSTSTTYGDDILFGDKFLTLNALYTTNVAAESGIIYNYLPTATATTVNGVFTAGVAAVSNPTVITLGSATFTAGDLILISGSGVIGNDGIYEVNTHIGTTLTIRGIGTVATTFSFIGNQFQSGSAGGVTTITKTAVSVFRCSTTGTFGVGSGNNTSSITFRNVIIDNYGVNQLLYSNASSNVTGLTSSNYGVLISNGTGVPSWLAAGTTGQVLIATTSAVPSWGTLSGIAVTSIAGTTNQINASASTGAVTLSLSSTMVTPGTLAVNGSLTSGSTLTSTSTNMYNAVLTGTQVSVDVNSAQYSLLINSTLNPTSGAASAFAIYTDPFLGAPSAQTITAAGSLYINNDYSTNVGTITNAYGILAAAGIGVGGTITNNYGGYFTTPGTGTNRIALYADTFFSGYTTTVTTSGGSQTLTNQSTTNQFYTGSFAYIVNLPAANTLYLGQQFIITNKSTATLTVRTSGLNTLASVTTTMTVRCTCILTSGTGTASWDLSYGGTLNPPITTVNGTTNQINSSTSTARTATLSLSSTIVTPGTVAVNGALSAGTVFSVRGAGSATTALNLAYFGQTGAATVGNLYSIYIDKSGTDALSLGINKNTITGSVPANSTFISTFQNASAGLSIGRGNSAGLPSTSDIFINSTGQVGISTTSPTQQLEIGGTSAQLYLNSATSNMIQFNINGGAAPTFTTARSDGTKIILYPAFVNGSSADHAIGIEANASWYAVPTTSQSHKFYGGITEWMRLNNTGLTVGSTTTTGMLNIGTAAQFQVSSTGAVTTSTSLAVGGPLNGSSIFTAIGSGGTTGTTHILGYLGSGSSPTATNLYSVMIDKSGSNSLILGINKNSTTGSIPSNGVFMTTYNSTGTISIGRGDNTGLPSTADIFINSTGLVGINSTNPTEAIEVGGTNSKIYMNSGTSNMLIFNTSGFNPPSTVTRSVGTKLVLYPEVGASSTDYALGIAGNTLWYSTSSTAGIHQWYGSTTEFMRLTSTGLGIGNITPGFRLEVNGTTATTFLVGRNNTQNANDTLYLGDSTANRNFFLDRSGAGSTMVFGFNTTRGTGPTGMFQIYNNSTNRNLLFTVYSQGSSTGSNAIFCGANIGQGVNPPLYPLHIYNATSTAMLLRYPTTPAGDDGQTTGMLFSIADTSVASTTDTFAKAGIFFDKWLAAGSGRGRMYICNNNSTASTNASKADSCITLYQTQVGIGIDTPINHLSICPRLYQSAGTAVVASQTGYVVTATGGTPFTAAMVGCQLSWSNGLYGGIIVSYSSTTVVTVSISQTISSQDFSITYQGAQIDTTGDFICGITYAPTGTVMNVSPFNTGAVNVAGTAATIQQSGTTTVTGVNTNFTSVMIGMFIIYSDGVIDTIRAVASTTSITVTTSRTKGPLGFTLHYPGLQVSNTGQVSVGGTLGNTALTVMNASWVPTAGYKAIASLYSTDTIAVDMGAGIILGGQYLANGTYPTEFAQIVGGKNNITAGNTDGNLIFSVKQNGGTLAEAMRISSNLGVQIGYTLATPVANGLIVSGNVSVGSSSANSQFNVGSSNQFQVTSAGLVGVGATPVTGNSITVGGTNNANIANPNGIYVNTSFSMTNSPTYTIGVQSIPTHIAASLQTISNACAMYTWNTVNTNVGTITNAIGILVDPGSAGAGTITNAYGAYIRTPAHGTNRVALYADNCAIGGTLSAGTRLTVTNTGSASGMGDLAIFTSGSGPTAGNLYSIYIDKNGVEALSLGINKNTTTGSIPANACFISSYSSAPAGIAIGRGNGAGLPSSADIFISSTGDVGINTISPQILSNSRNLTVKGVSGATNAYISSISFDGGASVSLYSGTNNTDNPSIVFQRSLRFGSANDAAITGYTERLRIDSNGNITPGTGALATNATNGFVYEETCAGKPTGVPTSYTGRAAKVYDSTNNSDYVYNGGWVAIVPTGCVMQFVSRTIPTGWLICEGAAVSRTTWAALFAVIGTAYGNGNGSTTFNVPDMRGMFARGQANGSANDPDRAARTTSATGSASGDNPGSAQTSQFGSHTHTANPSPFLFYGGGGGTGVNLGGSYTGPNTALTLTNSGGNETRPINLYFVYIIKT